MARNQTVTGQLQNIFALNRVRKECTIEPVRVDFSPTQRPNNQCEGIIPSFNKDKQYYTPAFVLPRDKICLEESMRSEKNKFEARLSHSQNQTEQQTVEYKPSDNMYCQLCQEYFSDYWEHINGKYHKRMINSSKFNKDISVLCQNFRPLEQHMDMQKTKKIVKKQTDKNVKGRDLKKQALISKQNQDKTTLKSQKMPIETKKIPTESKRIAIEKNQDEIQCSNSLKNKMEESLKIILQLGNYSTKMLSNNQSKQRQV